MGGGRGPVGTQITPAELLRDGFVSNSQSRSSRM